MGARVGFGSACCISRSRWTKFKAAEDRTHSKTQAGFGRLGRNGRQVFECVQSPAAFICLPPRLLTSSPTGLKNKMFFLELYGHAAPMKSGKQLAIVLVTAPEMKTARKLAKAALTSRLAACVNLVPKLESHFWWQGKIDVAAEVLMIFKTSIPRLWLLEQLVLGQHPYDTPEFVVLPVTAATELYEEWWRASVRPRPNA
jgi:periplasmic divalent cation tolerance protein